MHSRSVAVRIYLQRISIKNPLKSLEEIPKCHADNLSYTMKLVLLTLATAAVANAVDPKILSAMKDFYTSTNGDHWKNNSGWVRSLKSRHDSAHPSSYYPALAKRSAATPLPPKTGVRRPRRLCRLHCDHIPAPTTFYPTHLAPRRPTPVPLCYSFVSPRALRLLTLLLLLLLTLSVADFAPYPPHPPRSRSASHSLAPLPAVRRRLLQVRRRPLRAVHVGGVGDGADPPGKVAASPTRQPCFLSIA